MRKDTGLTDKFGNPIHAGDVLRIGMRRGDDAGWSTMVVAWNEAANEWGLLDARWPEKREFGQMQWDERLREIVAASGAGGG